MLVRLRSVFRADLAQTVQLRLRAEELVTQQRLAADELRHLAVDLLHLLDHHLAQQLLTQLGDGHDRTRTLATLVGGGLVCTVVALVAHVCHSTLDRCCCQAGRLRLWTDCG